MQYTTRSRFVDTEVRVERKHLAACYCFLFLPYG